MKAYHLFKELIHFYTAIQLLNHISINNTTSFTDLKKTIKTDAGLNDWLNIGGQLIPVAEVNNLIKKVKDNTIKSWRDLHDLYLQQSNNYPAQKLLHALVAFEKVTGISINSFNEETFTSLLNTVVATKEWMTQGIYDSRAKDYSNPYRKMIYDNLEEMNAVMGNLEENSFINQQKDELEKFKKQVAAIKKQFKLYYLTVA
jgi:hypothetical protein